VKLSPRLRVRLKVSRSGRFSAVTGAVGTEEMSSFPGEIETPSPRRALVFSLASSLRLPAILDTQLALPFAAFPQAHPHNAMRPWSSPAIHQHAMREQALRVDCAFWFPKNEFAIFRSWSPFHPFHWARLRGNSCALRLRVFCFSVSSQKSSRTTAKYFCAPPEMQTLALGADPSRFQVPQLQGQRRLNKCTRIASN
jgi:hypothetical protein